MKPDAARIIRVLLAVIACVASASCSKSDSSSDEVGNFSLNGAAAAGLVRASSFALTFGLTTPNLNLASSSTAGTLISIASDGTVTQASTNDIDLFYPVQNGLYVKTRAGNSFYVKNDGTSSKIATTATYEGENSAGDLIFSDGSVFRVATRTLEELSTVLSDVVVQSLSGNFAVLRSSNGVFQVFDTVTTARYNIADCNGPRVVALSTSKAIVNDCASGQELIDMSTGTRSASAIGGFNHEAVSISGGAVFLSETCPGAGSNYGLCGVDTTGAVTQLIARSLSPGSSSCMNCGYANSVLFGTGTHFVVRELTKVTYYKIAGSVTGQILNGYNVAGVSVNGNVVYYTAEDTFGTPRVGKYDLDSSTDTPFTVGVSGTVERISAIP